ncbi:hypothetical protein CPU12_13335 [Malaciobacter molluscorum LMG 25693]|uniref:Plasminogen-binding protein PgbA N-terminal domain-containing protein n=1 Tax=Malaciobacter molluscorum LMG 25693 TaxID=870501 RepID=A0A2G1DEG8_9BACT|nr:plasminogen-binding N-terminal domain-containing protein [Malaciobacter molluscorum]AXX91196.1 hypothetical protein AMOL_0160 [Malaciobacter molluscorum LMG 25693]PHO16899.1 hypothetical protein CPU12_13335 [Malaciobacter molluscorum LMG 25693]RXJ91932.1 hypothetical protein CRV00_13630 [Malaciobacter molluscorum]
MKQASTKLFLAILALFTTTILSAQTTVCYKKDWTSPSTIDKVKLDGGMCQGEASFLDMKKKGWKLKDIRITSSKKGLNYQYILTTKTVLRFDNKKFVASNVTPGTLTFNTIKTQLTNVTKNSAIINIGNLRVGQSGIVIKTYDDGQKIIIANAYVEATNDTASKVKFLRFEGLKQNALPNSKSIVQENDTLILNYMYDKSLLIAPSQDAFIVTRAKFRNNTFLHSDIFAAKLKADREPLPSKTTIQKFAKEQNLGTIFIVISNKVYIIDSKTFAVLDTFSLAYNYLDTDRMPFYTRITGIEESMIDSVWKSIKKLSILKDLFGDDERSEEEILLEGEMTKDEIVNKNDIYVDYYKTILGLK